MEIKDKVCIVTGASGGIGLSTAKLLGKLGAKVVLASRSEEVLTNLSKEIPQSFVIVTNMTKPKDIKKMVEQTLNHYGRVDVLINNAGQAYYSSLEDFEMEKIRYLYDLNVFGPITAMQEVIPHMRKQGGGTIVNISSGTTFMYIPNLGAYSSSKRALNGLTLTSRNELSDDGIVVSVVYPYTTRTDFGKNALTNEGTNLRKANYNSPESDSPELVAEKIVEVIKSGEPEIFLRDFMRSK